jgi:phasin family protein
MRTPEEFISFSQGNVEALVKSSQIWATGLQDMSKQAAISAQASFEDAMQAMKALTGVKSLREAMDLQTTLVRSSMEKAVAQTGQLTDASVKLAEQAMAPLAARVSVAIEANRA